MKVLENLQPAKVFKYFEEMSMIPRGSGNEKGISDYLVNFAKERNLEVIQDEALNVIIKKKASKGYENAPGVIIQGHMDMVCEKTKESTHDFMKDPLQLRVEGDNVYATNTTLGADNGIAVAYALAILDDDSISHPALEVLVTTDEETGMGGAMAFDGSLINGKYLLNIDSEEEGKLLVSCAGGLRTKVVLDTEFENNTEKELLRIEVKGLKGGHSGMEIIKQRGNSNKLMGRVLAKISESVTFNIVEINGGSKNNAIPREAECIIAVESDNIKEVTEIVTKMGDNFKNELLSVDENVKVVCEHLNNRSERIMSEDTTKKIIALLNLIPSGVDTMSMDIEDLVQSSTNLGVVKTNKNNVEFDSATRSSVGTLKEDLVSRIKIAAQLTGASVETSGEYPEWQYEKNSKLRELCKEVYKRLSGQDAEIIALHAGLECGLFKEKLHDVDMISFGPNLYDVHTPNEHMSIKSVQNVWKFLLEILKEIK
ncbi:MAG: aminoacyl-histidine dipeptidase [Inconstantimicrobium porci]|uniref:Cytosol non-specific dipeptidase n=1 Tax=Inconstantimicrobium porci TaxID=2652291 RepID=A0A7X2MXI7_9CLOT|nr:aminoacyl-histidine dipeptidase [Inconstantimicrobium porci]MDD6770494.1 aminoacyl-histidine dipeptidase [Inconstantimicrobium porci]MDY5910983.1 aminoacyl-histidine dipeptidase [Inconstantimicrobium porci]MSR90865.1 aminoacyl-histidine dipeptidase [Inconstantimicrobium porci]